MATPPQRLRTFRPAGAPEATPTAPAAATPGALATPWAARTAGGVAKPMFMPNLAAAGRKPKKEEGGEGAPGAVAAASGLEGHYQRDHPMSEKKKEKMPRTGMSEKHERRRSAPMGGERDPMAPRGEGLFSAGPPTGGSGGHHTGAGRGIHHFATQRPRMKAKVEEVENIDSQNVTHPVMLPFRSPPAGAEDWDVPPQELLANGTPSGSTPLFFIQMPAVLPATPPPAPTPAPKAKDAKADKDARSYNPVQAAVTALGSGHVGKLTVYKSGRMRLTMGDVVFDVAPGLKPSFLQHVAVVSTPPPPPPAPPPPAAGGAAAAAPAPVASAQPSSEHGHLHMLGSVHHRLVCVPNIAQSMQRPPT